eukprot:jgi/Botrbrau1/13076/Bobra.0187s0038.1
MQSNSCFLVSLSQILIFSSCLKCALWVSKESRMGNITRRGRVAFIDRPVDERAMVPACQMLLIKMTAEGHCSVKAKVIQVWLSAVTESVKDLSDSTVCEAPTNALKAM